MWRPIRLYGPARTREELLVTAAVAAAMMMSLALVSPWALAGALLAALIGIALSVRRPADECALCGTTRAKAKLLVTAPSVGICDRCAGLPMALVAENLEAKQQRSDWLEVYVSGLPRQCPTRISRPMLEALGAEVRDAPKLRAVATGCFERENNELGCELLQRIPEAERLAGDWINLGFGLGKRGRYAEAIAVTTHALEHGDGSSRALCLNNIAVFRLKLEPGAPAPERARWLAEVEEATRLLAARTPTGWRGTLQACRGTEADLKRSLGDVFGALDALAAAEKLGPHTGERQVIRARVYAAAGKPVLARAAAEAAIELLHPESLAAADARALLAGLVERASAAPG
jgi:tetratricopeptide (TPR) repeat protein